MSHDIKRVIYGEDGTVCVHYHFRHAPDQRGLAVVDLFRIERGYSTLVANPLTDAEKLQIVIS